MTKRIEFVTRREGIAPADFAQAWRESVVRHACAPEDARPHRIVRCVCLRDDVPPPRHDGVLMEWFSDAGRLERFEAWSRAQGEASAPSEVVDGAASKVVLAEEMVRRGAGWLQARWRRGGPKFKHMALARRAGHLTPDEFSRQWQARAGVVAGPGGEGRVEIPATVKGLAYVQNHPLPRPEGEWAYDAINEVYFDDRAGLQRRVEWFAEHLADPSAESDLVGDHTFLSVVEEVVPGPT